MIDLSNFSYGYQAIDKAHLYLIQGLLASSKPKRILELGVGTGNVSQIVLQANIYNDIQAELTCVDNWQDWKGEVPKIAVELIKLGAKIVTQAEKQFVEENASEKYDFIISDGAHGGSHQWCGTLYDMLNPKGILVAHDVTNKNFPNLRKYITEAESRGYANLVFETSSRNDERCERGLLVAYNS